MVTISLTLEDLNTILQGLDSDFYVNGTPEQEKKFWLHLEKLRGRLNKILEKEKKLQDLNNELKHVQFCISHGVGFQTDEGFAKMDKINKIIKEMKCKKSGENE